MSHPRCGTGASAAGYRPFRARHHADQNLLLAGEGDNRILTRNDPDEIDAMVQQMIDTAHLTGGYMMCVGNHIPWNVTPEGIRRYLNRSAEWAHR